MSYFFKIAQKVDTPQRIMIKNEINRNFLTLAIRSTSTSQSLGQNLSTRFSQRTCSPPPPPPSPKFCKTIDCFQFLLCITVVPREMEENDYAKRFSFLFFFFFSGGGGEGGTRCTMVNVKMVNYDRNSYTPSQASVLFNF